MATVITCYRLPHAYYLYVDIHPANNNMFIALGDVHSVVEFLRPLGVEFRNCLKLQHLTPLLQAREPRFLTDAEDGELNVIRSDEEKASKFLMFLEKKGNPKRVLELLYLSLMDSYVDYGEEHHRNLAVMMFERGT